LQLDGVALKQDKSVEIMEALLDGGKNISIIKVNKISRTTISAKMK
jgi:hypothetical protein